MKKLLCLGLGAFLSTIVYAQVFSIVAGDTNGLSQHHCFNPPEHIERSSFGMENPIVYNLDVNLDGFDDITIKCGNSIGALGMASNYFTVKSIDSNDICYEYVDSSYCFNGYKPLYFAKMFNSRDTISFEMSYGQNEIIISKQFWIMKDTCSIYHVNIGAKYLAVRLNSHGINGLAWVNLELFAQNLYGFSADLRETGYKSITTSIPKNVFSAILIYPNPSYGFVNIDIPELDGKLTASIFDLSGNEILVKELNTKKTTLKLGSGTFVMKVSDKSKNLLIKKLIVL
jgi:hypothetical protein